MTKYEPKTTELEREAIVSFMEQFHSNPHESKWVKVVTDLAHCEACLQETQKELYRRNAQLEQALAEKQLLSDQLLQEINDSCQVDTDVRVEARKVLPADKVDGDTYAVPDVVEIVAMLVKEVERLKGIMKELQYSCLCECFPEPCPNCKRIDDNLCNYISKASLPKLPEGWNGPFRANAIYVGFVEDANKKIVLTDLTMQQATFLANLLNVCYPAKENH